MTIILGYTKYELHQIENGAIRNEVKQALACAIRAGKCDDIQATDGARSL